MCILQYCDHGTPKKRERTLFLPVHKNEKSQSFYLSDDTGSVFIPGELIPSLKREVGDI